MINEPLLWALILPGIVLGSFAQSMVRSKVSRFSKLPLSSGLTGQQVARHILDARGLRNVSVEPAEGVLSDHYDPITKVLGLSEAVWGVRSIAAAGIAAHEAGHAIQDADDYFPMELRTAIVPVVKAGASLGPAVFLAGLLFGSQFVTWMGAILFGSSTFFSVIALPVEFDASRRALNLLEQAGVLQSDIEKNSVRQVLRSAAWTYVAAAVTALGSWITYFFIDRRR